MLTFKELESALHKWAHHFQNDRFEHWELINQVWMMGNIQKLKYIKFASQRIKWDMIDYMRASDKTKTKKRCEEKGKHFPRQYSISTFPSAEDDNGTGALRDKICKQKLNMEDCLNVIFEKCSRTIKLMMKLKFIDGFQFNEIAKILGYHPTRITQLYTEIIIRKSLMQKVKRIYDVRNNGEKKKIFSYYNQNMEKERSYNRIYYQINKEKIQARRRRAKETKSLQFKIVVDNS